MMIPRAAGANRRIAGVLNITENLNKLTTPLKQRNFLTGG
jgi:hypothetical protein